MERAHQHPLYFLHWGSRDERIQARHEQWNAAHWPGVDIPWVPPLAPEWEAWLCGLRFALSDDYLDEIRRTTRAAIEEWAARRSFDTAVRDFCLRPAEAFVAVAFFLLGDCIYDVEANYFSRDPRRCLFRHAAAYKFWCGQTGGGLLQDLADFDRLRLREINLVPLRCEEVALEVAAFLAMIEGQEQQREAVRARRGAVAKPGVLS